MPHANRVQGVEASTGGGLRVPGTSGADRSDLVARLRGEVDAELTRVRGAARLVERDRIGRFGLFALLVAIGTNAWGFVRYGDRYMLMWVVASLYFYMFYWILPLVHGVALALLHREASGDKRPSPGPKRLIRSVKEARLLRFKSRLIAVGWNVWFLGGVSMTAGYLAIFSIDLLYALIAGFVYRGLTVLTVVLIVAQSVGIILYYLAVYLLRPYSADFSAWLSALMRGRRERREQGHSGLAPTALLAALSFMLAVLLVIAILFPGHTLDRILPVNQLRAVGYHLYLLVLLASQLAIMLVFHSWLSRSIARPVLASNERALAREARALRLLQRRGSPRRRLRRIDRAVSLLTETRLYRVTPIRLAGLYTLFLLGSDFLALLSLRDARQMDLRLHLPGRR